MTRLPFARDTVCTLSRQRWPSYRRSPGRTELPTQETLAEKYDPPSGYQFENGCRRNGVISKSAYEES